MTTPRQPGAGDSHDNPRSNWGDAEEAVRECWRASMREAWEIFEQSRRDGRAVSRSNLLRRFRRQWCWRLRREQAAVEEIAMEHGIGRAIRMMSSWQT